MANRERNVGINIRVTPEEKKKIMRYAKRCRLTTSEYIRKVAAKDELKVFIPKEIEDSFLKIRSIIHDMDEDRLTETDPVSKSIVSNYSAELLRITVETLQLMRNINTVTEDKTDGND